jgi:hypothetical protein
MLPWPISHRTPRLQTPGTTHDNCEARVFWTRAGIALWIYPKSLAFLPAVSRLDMNGGGGLPVREVAAERLAFVKEIA